MSATCEHPDDEAVLHADCRDQTPPYGLPVYQGWQPTHCPRCKHELSIVRAVAGSEWRCNACSARYPIDVQLSPSRPIAALRADLAELASVRAVCRDHDEWTGGALDIRREALVLQAEAIVGRVIGAMIAGSAPSSTPALEARALEDEPRPGSWYGEDGADGRMLDQEQTDALIRRELFARSHPFVRSHPAMLGEVTGIVGHPRVVPLDIQGVELTRSHNISGDHDGTWMDATRQRGGIDSDPLVRLLSFRAWGDRDRRWFEDRGVRRGEDCAVWPTSEGWAIAALQPWEQRGGVAPRDANPGELVDAGFLSAPYVVRVSDRLRLAPPPGPRGEARTTRARAL